MNEEDAPVLVSLGTSDLVVAELVRQEVDRLMLHLDPVVQGTIGWTKLEAQTNTGVSAMMRAAYTQAITACTMHRALIGIGSSQGFAHILTKTKGVRVGFMTKILVAVSRKGLPLAYVPANSGPREVQRLFVVDLEAAFEALPKYRPDMTDLHEMAYVAARTWANTAQLTETRLDQRLN